jgi:hypothetical protein
MWIVQQIQPRWPPLDPVQQQVLDSIERDRPYPRSIIDGLRYFRERERFRQPKNLYELRYEFGLVPPPERGVFPGYWPFRRAQTDVRQP